MSIWPPTAAPLPGCALAAHVRDEHGWTIYTSEYEDYTTLSAKQQAAHENEQRELLYTCDAFHRPHPHHGPVPGGAEPDGEDGPR